MATLYWPFSIDTVSEWPGGVDPSIRDGVHMGTDFAVPQGSALLATVTGRISRIYQSVKDGWGIDINREDGLIVRNWHLSQIDVVVGQTVDAGQVIGLTGGAKGTPGAGNSTGPHLHWELRTNSNFSQEGWLDPRPLNPATFGQEHKPTDYEETMTIIKANNGCYFLVREDQITYVEDLWHVELLRRMMTSDPSNPYTFDESEIPVLQSYLKPVKR